MQPYSLVVCIDLTLCFFRRLHHVQLFHEAESVTVGSQVYKGLSPELVACSDILFLLTRPACIDFPPLSVLTKITDGTPFQQHDYYSR